MIRAPLIPALAAAALLAACSTAPTNTAYYAPGAAPVTVAGSTATYSAGTGTVAGGVNTVSSGERIVVGEPAPRTTVTPGPAAPSGALVGGSTLNSNPNAGTPSQPGTPQPPSR